MFFLTSLKLITTSFQECSDLCPQIMAVPFVKDWDVVQTLGEGAYGE